MTRKEAAEFLGISEKSVSRKVASGEIVASVAAGKPGRQLEFDRADLERFRDGTGETERERQDETSALVPRVPAPLTPIHAGETALAQMVRVILAETGQTTQHAPHVPTADKIALSLDEAAALSGVSRAHLNQARKDGRLRARRIGHGYKVLRDDLETFMRALFD